MARQRSSSPVQSGYAEKVKEASGVGGRESSNALRKLADAMGTLTTSIRTGLIPSLAKKGGAVVGAAAGKPAEAFTMLSARILGVLGPIGMLASMLSQTSSGFGTFLKAVQVLSATLAPLLLPGFALLGAGVLTLADIIHAKLAPVLKDWMVWILTHGIEGFKKFMEAMTEAGEWAKKAWEFAKDPLGTKKDLDALDKKGGMSELYEMMDVAFGKALDEARKANPNITPKEREQLKKDIYNRIDPANPKQSLQDLYKEKGWKPGSGRASWWEGFTPGAGTAGGAPGGMSPSKPPAAGAPGGKPAGGIMGKFVDNLGKFAKELQQSAGPAASFQGIAQANRNAQLAAINQSEFEATMMQRTQEAINALLEAVAEIRKLNVGAS